jgi:hypothetical protein
MGYLTNLQLKSEKQYISFFNFVRYMELLTNVNLDEAHQYFLDAQCDEWERCDECDHVGLNNCNCCSMCDREMNSCLCLDEYEIDEDEDEL